MVKKVNTIDNILQRYEKSDLITLIKLMLQQQPELEWMLRAPLPGQDEHMQVNHSNAGLYSSQIEQAVTSAAEHCRDRAYRVELQNVLTTLQTLAEKFAKEQDTLAALTLYEVLVAESTRHFYTLETGYLIFTPVLHSCIDGLDTCFADGEEDQEIRRRVLQSLFAIYRFSAGSPTDLGEDIPDLLVENATAEERQMIAGWVRYALADLPDNGGSSDEQARFYRQLLRRLEK